MAFAMPTIQTMGAAPVQTIGAGGFIGGNTVVGGYGGQAVQTVGAGGFIGGNTVVGGYGGTIGAAPVTTIGGYGGFAGAQTFAAPTVVETIGAPMIGTTTMVAPQMTYAAPAQVMVAPQTRVEEIIEYVQVPKIE